MMDENCENDGITLLPLSSKRLARENPGFNIGNDNIRFEDSVVWEATKSTCSCLFRTLGRYYDELWFPTVVNEWCMLYYRCNHAAEYWEKKDEWLAGDEEVRMAVWSEILGHRQRYDKRLVFAQRENNKCNAKTPDLTLMRMYGVTKQDDLAKIVEMHGAINVAKDQIDLKVALVEEVDFTDPAVVAAEKEKAEREAAEIALADPDDDPNWVVMRRRMRGSFSGLRLAWKDHNTELLHHILIELCKYWSNLPAIDDEIEPLLARNIMREINNFRTKVFDMDFDGDVEPERMQSCSQSQEPRPPVSAAEGPVPQQQPKPKSRTSCNRNRAPATTKLAEARARQNAARVQGRK